MTRRTSYRYGKVDNHAPERQSVGITEERRRFKLAVSQANALAAGKRGRGQPVDPTPITLPRVSLADPAEFDNGT